MKRELRGALLILFSDSTVVEGAVNKENLKSKELFKLVYKLRKYMRYGFAILVIYITGTCMIVQSMDGLSQGILNQGALATGSIRLYAPMNLTATERSPTLEA